MKTDTLAFGKTKKHPAFAAILSLGNKYDRSTLSDVVSENTHVIDYIPSEGGVFNEADNISISKELTEIQEKGCRILFVLRDSSKDTEATAEFITANLNNYVIVDVPVESSIGATQKLANATTLLHTKSYNAAYTSIEILLETIFIHGIISIDFNDIQSVIKSADNMCFVSISGKNSISDRMLAQLDSVASEYSITNAKGVLFVVQGSTNSIIMDNMKEVNNVFESFTQKYGDTLEFKWGLISSDQEVAFSAFLSW